MVDFLMFCLCYIGAFPFLPTGAPGTQMLQNIIANYMQTTMQQAAACAKPPASSVFLNNNTLPPMKVPNQHDSSTDRTGNKIDQLMEHNLKIQGVPTPSTSKGMLLRRLMGGMVWETFKKKTITTQRPMHSVDGHEVIARICKIHVVYGSSSSALPCQK